MKVIFTTHLIPVLAFKYSKLGKNLFVCLLIHFVSAHSFAGTQVQIASSSYYQYCATPEGSGGCGPASPNGTEAQVLFCESIGAIWIGNYAGGTITKCSPDGISFYYGQMVGGGGCALGYTASGSMCTPDATLVPLKNLGAPDDGCKGNSNLVGNPINAGTLNKLHVETDYLPRNAFVYELSRIYNSNSNIFPKNSNGIRASYGLSWRNKYDQKIELINTTGLSTAVVGRPDGRSLFFSLIDGNWAADSDINGRLQRLQNSNGVTTGWKYVTATDEIEVYDAGGRLSAITYRDGIGASFIYDAYSNLIEIRNSLGISQAFAYDSKRRVISSSDPAGEIYQYAYDSHSNLLTVQFPDGAIRQYHYENATFKNALTGITDERGVRYATYSYDSSGRAISSEHAGGVDRHTLAFGTNATTVTDSLGTARTYNFQTVLGVVKNTGVSQPGGSGCGPAAEALAYDVNGNVASRTDFNGKKTTYAYDLARNLETNRTEGLASSGAALPESRTITTSWHPTWRLPVEVNEYAGASASGNPLRRTITAYDDRGNITSRSITDVAAGVTRAWTTAYTYSVAVFGLILQKVEDGPRTDVADTTVTDYYPHDEVCAGAEFGTGRDKGCRGQVSRVTNPLGQVTQFTRYNAHGQAEEIVDPNGVVTTLTYDLRQRLTSRATAGETTSFQYDPVGQLTRLTQPDGSYIAYTYDGARRLTEVADNLGNRIAYTLDAAGNRTKEEVFDPQGTLAKTLSRAYDALGRMQTLAGVGND